MKLTTEAPLYLAIDPGYSSGWALFNTLDGTFASGEIEGRGLLYRFIENVMDEGQPVHLIGERFDIGEDTEEMTRQLDALYILGGLDYLAAKTGITLVIQNRSSAKVFGKDDKLQALGWWFRGGDGHANDAARHLLTYLVAHGSPEIKHGIAGILMAELV